MRKAVFCRYAKSASSLGAMEEISLLDGSRETGFEFINRLRSELTTRTIYRSIHGKGGAVTTRFFWLTACTLQPKAKVLNFDFYTVL